MNSTPAPAVSAFRSLAELHAEHSRLMDKLERFDEDTLPKPMLDEIKTCVARAVATGARLSLLSDRADAQGVLTYWASVAAGSGASLRSSTLAPFDTTQAIQELGAKCPYKGLLAFQPGDADLFFGRRDLIREIVQTLKSTHTLAVLGISGSGKSSLVRAGLVPMLAAGSIPGSKDWRYVGPLVPGSYPLASLADSIQPEGEDQESWRTNQAREFRLSQKHLLASLDKDGRTAVIFVDQLEEVFTLSHSDDDKRGFLENLAYLVQEGNPRHFLVLTMRSEFDVLLMQTPLAGMLRNSRVRVPSLLASELAEAIEKPAERFGVTFDNVVVQGLIKSVQNEPAGLPLLQFALLKLWQARQGDRITTNVYKELGGSPQQILVNAADETYRSLKILEDQERCRMVFLSLIKPGDGIEVTSRRRLRSELNFIGPAEGVEALLKRLENAGLLLITRCDQPDKALIELSHESITRNWPELVGWVRQDLPKLRRRQLLEETAEQWTRAPQTVTLYNGAQLKEANDFPDLSGTEKSFLKASGASERSRTRDTYVGFTLLALLSAALLLGAYWTNHNTSLLRDQLVNKQAELSAKEKQLQEREKYLNLQARSNQDALTKIPTSEQPVINAARPEIYFQIPDDNLHDRALDMIAALRAVDPSYLLPGVQRLDPANYVFAKDTQVRYFHPEDMQEAEKLAQVLGKFGTAKAVAPYKAKTAARLATISARHFEVWVGTATKPKAN